MDLHDEVAQALIHLGESRRHIQRAGAGSQDWSANEALESDYQALRQQITDFAHSQLGLPVEELRNPSGTS